VGLALTDAKLLGRMTLSLCAFYRAVAESTPASALWQRAGITAAIVPASPDRSVLNAVVYEQDADLEETLPELAAAYDQAGVNAWTVWVPPGDERTPGLLERAGHRLDAPPPAMAAEIASIDLAIAPAQWGRAEDLREVAEINERAYGYDRGDFTDALVGRPQGVYAYVARLHGRSVSCAVAVDHEGDCCITLVATESHVRGRGMASGLIGLALSEARERGCETTSLQASRAGYPVYRKLGYRDLGAMGMWERRRQPPERAG
jgi:GNAT superfamily N-acetyltransferase